MSFRERYGPWCVVLGASEGLGAAFADEAAARDVNVVLAARRAAALQDTAKIITDAHRVETRTVALDLGDDDFLEALRVVTDPLDVGLLVFNATSSFVGRLLDEGFEHALEQVAVNVTAPLAVCEHFGSAMVRRGRGGVVLMGSGAGVAGTAGLAVYSATKAFQLTLAQALHEEWRGDGVDVLGVVGPAIDTPNFRRSFDHDPDQLPNPPLAPAQVAREALDALGETMEMMPGEANRAGYEVLSGMPRIDQARMLSARFAATSRHEGA